MPEFVSFVYFEGQILCFTKMGDVYEFIPREMTWRALCRSPFIRKAEREPTLTSPEIEDAAKKILDLMLNRYPFRVKQDEVEAIIGRVVAGFP